MNNQDPTETNTLTSIWDPYHRKCDTILINVKDVSLKIIPMTTTR